MNDKLGATGKFPQGKLNEDDEGELQIGVAKDAEGKIIINFGKPVAWIGLDAQSALGFAKTIIKKLVE